MMRSMRANAKYVFFILIAAFVGWMAVGQVMEILQPSGNVVLRVNGKEVQVTEYQQRLQVAYEQYRRQNGNIVMTREDEQQLQDQLVEQIISELLLSAEYRRLGIEATDDEVIEAVRTSPPPEVMQDPQFQTDGQFDLTKWQRFLQSGADRAALMQLEAIYRERIPQIKLAQFLTADVYVSDAKLWRIYKDQHDSATVAALPTWAVAVAVSESIPVTDAELERYLRGHEDEFTRPAMAFVRFIAHPRLPNAADTAAARARVERIRAELARGARFADVARRESADTVTGNAGGDIGWIKRNETGFDRDFLAATLRLRPGQTSAPVTTQFGYHLIRVDQARGDSLKVSHILVRIELQGDHLDAVEARADSIERYAADQADGARLDSAARRFNLPLSPLHRIIDGQPLHLGIYRIPDVSVWAFEARPGETSPVVEALPAYYVFRLDSLVPAGVPPLDEVRAEVTRAVRVTKGKAVARQRADSLATALRGVPELLTARVDRGLPVERHGAFTRLNPPGWLAREPVVIGAAFGLRVGERSGVIEGEGGSFLLESLGRKMADSSAWLAQRDSQRIQILGAARQARIQQYVSALRAQAKVVDRRKEIFRATADAEPLPTALF